MMTPILSAVLRRIENKLTDFEAKLEELDSKLGHLAVTGVTVSMNVAGLDLEDDTDTD